MAEIVLFIGNHSQSYEDGDVLCAFNKRRIQHVHAEMIVHPWKSGLNEHGLYVPDSLPDKYCQHCYQYKFQRISQTEVRRTNLVTLEEDIISGTPNAKGEQMDVELYVNRRLAARTEDGKPKKAIFGEPGFEYWYGGHMDFSQGKIDLVWNDIEAVTVKRRADHTLWPLSETEKRHFLAVPVDEFDDDTANDLVAPKLDILSVEEEKPVLKKRKHKVNWRDIFPLNIPPSTSIADVEDRGKIVDPRGRAPFRRNNLILTK